jgi:hypothetical protein
LCISISHSPMTSPTAAVAWASPSLSRYSSKNLQQLTWL